MRINSKLIILSMLITISCSKGKQKQKTGLKALPIVEVVRKDIVGYSSYPVSIEGVENIKIRPKIQGFIEEIYVDEGEEVKEGQLMFKLEAQSLDARAQASADAIKTVQARVNTAKIEVDKLKPLVRQGIISDVELKSAYSELNSAKAQLDQAKNNYKSVKRNVNYSNVTSPVDGVVARIPYEPGALVSATDPIPLTEVSKLDKIYAYFALNEKDYISFLRNTKGQSLQEKINNFSKVSLRLADDSTYQHQGVIQTTTAHVNSDTGTIQFRAIFPNPERLLANGNSGTILIPKNYKNTLVIPEQSSYERQTLTYVFKVTEGDTLRSKNINVETRINNYILIESGLKEGDKILAEGINQVRDGMKIQPREIPLDSIMNSINPVFKN
ncbi:efflux RND transporter periplasmic adaptor subunit [Aquimarina celericrescens]|uniref:Efflux RND transporter periplasmic adaptor subunit n=1 Tax=Aquimarina celericrescens TaxID=1964542 RepID=A0ABW5AZQ9_9FLAO|nr:efflux RND transporter periplasmic adaptor subunit [Aquimarina celericrescens]